MFFSKTIKINVNFFQSQLKSTQRGGNIITKEATKYKGVKINVICLIKDFFILKKDFILLSMQ